MEVVMRPPSTWLLPALLAGLSGLVSCNDSSTCKDVLCEALDQCHDVGVCDPDTGTCSNPTKLDGAQCDDGNACSVEDSCLAGECMEGTPVACAALDQCHDAGVCDPATGACSNPLKVVGASCNDGDACTLSDTCQAGTCSGAGRVVCGGAAPCHPEQCDPATGACTPTSVVCTPLDACHLAGTCDPTTGTCSNPAAPDGTGCNAGNVCTVGDTCLAGFCLGGSAVVCTAASQCHYAGTCAPTTGCSNPPVPNGTPCDDRNPGTVDDRCLAGLCVPGIFLPTGSMSSERAVHTATLLANGKVLVAGGQSLSLGPPGTLSSAELFDPATGTFTATGSMASGRARHTATLLPGDTVLLAGGGSSSAEIYHPVSGTFAATGAMTTSRTSHTATLLKNGKVLVAGGEASSAEVYDPAAGTFKATGGMATRRALHTATLLENGKVLVAGGHDGSALSSAELYDPVTGTFSATGSMNASRSSHTAVLLAGGRVLVAGGGSSVAELYDPATGVFTTTGSMTVARRFHAAVLLRSGPVLLAGGWGGATSPASLCPLMPTMTASAEIYDSATGTFTAVTPMQVPRAFHSATVLLDGRLLVVGGQVCRRNEVRRTCSCVNLASAQLYSP